MIHEYKDNCYDVMLKGYDLLPPKQRKITDFIVSNMNEAVFFSITELAERVGTSETTIVRYARNLGFDGFPDFKQSLVEYYKNYISVSGRIQHSIEGFPKEKTSCRQIILKEIELLKIAMESIDESDFNKAVKAICKAETIYIFGNDLNNAVMSDLGYRLSRFRLRTVEASISEKSVFEKLLFIDENDLAIIFDFYRPSVDFTKLVDMLKSKKVPIFLITDTFVPPMIRAAKVVFLVKRAGDEVFYSQVVPMAISNGLVIGAAEYLGDKALKALEELSDMKNKYNLNKLEEFSL